MAAAVAGSTHASPLSARVKETAGRAASGAAKLDTKGKGRERPPLMAPPAGANSMPSQWSHGAAHTTSRDPELGVARDSLAYAVSASEYDDGDDDDGDGVGDAFDPHMRDSVASSCVALGPGASESYDADPRPLSDAGSGRAPPQSRGAYDGAASSSGHSSMASFVMASELATSPAAAPHDAPWPRPAGVVRAAVELDESGADHRSSQSSTSGAPMLATTPVAAGRVRSQAAPVGRMRNFSRPSTSSTLSQPASPPQPVASTSRHVTVPSSPSQGASARAAPFAVSQADMASGPAPRMAPGQRPPPAAPAGFAFPAPPKGAPSLSRGPSSSSSHEPVTPSSPPRVSFAHSDAFMSPRASPPRPSRAPVPSSSPHSLDRLEADDRTANEHAGPSRSKGKWKFWRRSRSIDGVDPADSWPPATRDMESAPLSVSTGHAEPATGRHRPSPRSDGLLSPEHALQYAAGAEGATELLRDGASASPGAPLVTRADSQLSYYSFHSVASSVDGDPAAVPAPLAHVAPTSLPPDSVVAARPRAAAGGSMAKVKASLDALKPAPAGGQVPAVGPRRATGPRKKFGESERILSPDDPEDCLQLGITCHEEGELERAAMFFERAATLGGGCGMGMLLWGLTLRHGWGCAVDPARGFTFLQQAAETVVEDLDAVVAHGGAAFDEDDLAAKTAKAELVLSIYELGMSFRKGWGVKKDKKIAISYFELASTLGDPDAQQELGFAYLYGKGTRKDKHKSAHYYRLAAKQGYTSFGQQWIHRRKYGGDEP